MTSPWRAHILTEENVLELARIVGEEIDATASVAKERLQALEPRIADVDSRLEHLYDALETGSFDSDELAPRIRRLQRMRDELLDKRREISVEAESSIFDLPELTTVRAYVDDLATLMASSSVIEQRGFLRSFVREIRVGADAVTVDYTVPMPPDDCEQDTLEVLPTAQHGRPCRARTCHTLIKSQVLAPAHGLPISSTT